MRYAEIKRATAETNIALRLNLDGRGTGSIDTGCGFLDHMLNLFARHGRFDLDSDSPVEAVKRAKKPILLIHGDDDRFVPYPMSVNIHAAAPEKIRFHTVTGAGHAMDQIWDFETYRKVVKEFTAEVL